MKIISPMFAETPSANALLAKAADVKEARDWGWGMSRTLAWAGFRFVGVRIADSVSV